jgi:hypothetical protein
MHNECLSATAAESTTPTPTSSFNLPGHEQATAASTGSVSDAASKGVHRGVVEDDLTISCPWTSTDTDEPQSSETVCVDGSSEVTDEEDLYALFAFH